MQLNRNFLFITTSLVVFMLFFSSSVETKKCLTVTISERYTKTIRPSNCPRSRTTTTSTTTKVIEATTTTTSTERTTTTNLIETTTTTTSTSVTTTITDTTTTTDIITTTETTTTSISFIPSVVTAYQFPEKRSYQNNKVICIPNKRQVKYKNGHCIVTIYCIPTIFLKCPEVSTIKSIFTLTTKRISTSIATINLISTITLTSTATSTSLYTSTSTSTSISTLTNISTFTSTSTSVTLSTSISVMLCKPAGLPCNTEDFNTIENCCSRCCLLGQDYIHGVCC
ncbi:hypothetical protein Glove_64g70 [Diversispora epigaea]|uniref:WAP domain-containing protein n=1 Tax=Diversispora epigaea TaxID=1348612 RepID=A0A397JFI0_9GLOM|nr:hypothetical protein Glove_64g70 [Diversispora epigaea]